MTEETSIKQPWESPTITVVARASDVRSGVIDLDEDFTGSPS
jgi:hypothetical protein